MNPVFHITDYNCVVGQVEQIRLLSQQLLSPAPFRNILNSARHLDWSALRILNSITFDVNKALCSIARYYSVVGGIGVAGSNAGDISTLRFSPVRRVDKLKEGIMSHGNATRFEPKNSEDLIRPTRWMFGSIPLFSEIDFPTTNVGQALSKSERFFAFSHPALSRFPFRHINRCSHARRFALEHNRAGVNLHYERFSLLGAMPPHAAVRRRCATS